MFMTPESLADLQSLLFPLVSMSSTTTSSSPCAAAKTANLNSLVAAGGGRWITSKAINNYLSEKEEDEYDYLQTKPELGDGKHRGSKKGRRHAGETLLQRKLSRQAYLVKDILVSDCQEAKHLGKKRRARLLSDHLDDFNVSVPYSLNRKNRWNALDDTAGCLVTSNTPTSATTSLGEPLMFSVVESYFRCNPHDGNRSGHGVRSYQEFNANGQLLTRREASSARGSLLHSLMEGNSSQENSGVLTHNPLVNVQYRLSQAHPVSKVMGINFSKNKCPKGKCVKRVTTELAANTGPKDFLEDEDAHDENEDELLGMYRPKNNTYTLYDFLKENQEDQPVLVRNKSLESFASEADIEEQYNFVLTNGIQLAESVILKPFSNDNDLPVPSQSFKDLTGRKPWLFQVVDLSLEDYSLHSPELWQEQQADLLVQFPNIQCHKLSETRLIIDLSRPLVGPHPDRPVLVLCVDQQLGKVVLNTAFKCDPYYYSHPKDRLRKMFCRKKSTTYTFSNGLAHIVKLVLERFRPFYLMSLQGDKGEKQEMCKSIHNSQRLAIQVQSADVYTILERQRTQEGFSDHGIQRFEMVFSSTQKNLLEEDVLSDISDFETIQMHEFEEQEEAAHAPVEKVAVKEVCEHCNHQQTNLMVHMLDNCGHRFCSTCLSEAFMIRLNNANKLPIKCLNEMCECAVSLELLQVVLPLPLANYTTSLHHLIQQTEAGKMVSECPSCTHLLAIHQLGAFGQLCCSQCDVHWCAHCRKEPHWPLKCAQAAEWSKKFKQQYQLDRQRAADDLLTPLPSPIQPKVCKRGNLVDQQDPEPFAQTIPAPQHNTIAQQFSLICSESRARRFDTKTSWQLTKNIRRLTSNCQTIHKWLPQWQRQFIDVRKTALHLVEYGYAWLYMNRVQSTRPQAWPQIKVILCSLRRQMEALDSELLFSSSMTDTQAVMDKLKKVEQLVDKVIDKFLEEPSKTDCTLN